jgi:hypothetical protein
MHSCTMGFLPATCWRSGIFAAEQDLIYLLQAKKLARNNENVKM